MKTCRNFVSLGVVCSILRVMLVLLSTVPNVLRAQFNYEAHNGMVIITHDDCPAALTIPQTVGDMPVTLFGAAAFYNCTSLGSVYFEGRVFGLVDEAFLDTKATVYCLPGTPGWSTSFGGLPTALWLPQVQTGDPPSACRQTASASPFTGPATRLSSSKRAQT
jgi:hypothetical protein